MDWERIARRVGGLLAGVGLLAVLVAGVVYALGARERAVQLGVGGLIAGLVGSMLLLLNADTIPPGQRPGRSDRPDHSDRPEQSDGPEGPDRP